MVVPPTYVEDYHKVCKSRYSTISEKYKNKILSFHGLKPTSKQFKILYRDESYYKELEEKLAVEISRLQEIGSVVDHEEETIVFGKEDIKEREKFTKVQW